MQVRLVIPDYFCWSKIGTESGELLQKIIARKEIERRANSGIFLWGVGNSVMPALLDLLRLGYVPQVLFSEIKSKPKVIDTKPYSVVLWLSAQDSYGKRVNLPPYSLITSRGDGPDRKLSKRSHYALLCESESQLYTDPSPSISIVASELVNFRTGKPLGASQVTAVVEKIRGMRDAHLNGIYPVSFFAKLRQPGQVRLLDPITLPAKVIPLLEKIILNDDVDAWRGTVADIKAAAWRELQKSRHHKEQFELAST